MRRVLTRGFGIMALAASMVLAGTTAEAQRGRRPKPPAPAPTQPAPVDLDAPARSCQGRQAGQARRQLAAAPGRPDDGRGRAGQAALRQREVVATPRWRSTASSTARPATTRATSRSRSTTSRSRSTASSSTRRATASSPRSPTSRTTSSSTRRCSGSRSSRPSLPEPADIVERVGKYNDEQIAQVQQPAAARSLLAAQLPARPLQVPEPPVRRGDRASSRRSTARAKYYVQAQFFSRHLATCSSAESVPAVQSFQRIVGAIDEGVEGVEDEARMRDLAFLSMARTYYSASVRLDEQQRADDRQREALAPRSSTGTRSTSRSEYWLDALFEESWAYFMAGDYPHALGNIHTIESPYFPNSFYPEADVLKAVIYFANCQYDDATTIVAQFQTEVRADPERARRSRSTASRARTRRSRSSSS